MALEVKPRNIISWCVGFNEVLTRDFTPWLDLLLCIRANVAVPRLRPNFWFSFALTRGIQIKCDMMNVRILTSEAEANNFLGMKRMDDFPNELLWESLKLKTRVLCPLPANNGGDNQQQVMPPNTLLNLAIPLIDSLHIEFAMIKERTLFNQVTRKYCVYVWLYGSGRTQRSTYRQYCPISSKS